MKSKITHTNKPITAKVVRDFLPRPEHLVLREKKKRITLTLTQHSAEGYVVVTY